MELLNNNPNLYTHLCQHIILKLTNYFGVTLNSSIAYRVGYFKVTLHVGIVFRARFSLKGIQTIQIGSFEAWVLHVGLILHLNLQYSNLYLPLPALLQYLHSYLSLPIGILRLRHNTYTRTSFNWNFGDFLQYLHPYLPSLTKNLGPNCNTCICTYFCSRTMGDRAENSLAGQFV